MKFFERSLQGLLSFAPSRLRRSLARSRETRFTRRNRRACLQAISQLSVTTFRNLQQPDILQEVLNMGGKTRNIAVPLILRQCCKTSCTFLLPQYELTCKTSLHLQ